MTPIIQGLAALTFLFTAEAGIIISTFNRTTSREFIWVYDGALGYDIGFAAHNPDAQYSIGGKKTSGAGISAASPGAILTIAHPTTGNGVTGGGVYTQSTASSHSEKNFVEINVSAIQKPGVT
jgi:hypothetical protein